MHGWLDFKLIKTWHSFSVSVLHKKVQELRNEKLTILKRAEMDRMSWEEQKQQFIIQLRQVIRPLSITFN